MTWPPLINRSYWVCGRSGRLRKSSKAVFIKSQFRSFAGFTRVPAVHTVQPTKAFRHNYLQDGATPATFRDHEAFPVRRARGGIVRASLPFRGFSSRTQRELALYRGKHRFQTPTPLPPELLD